ncbi:MAG: hypothetical protein AAGA87_02480 [Pseudomonadota bacterium]
MSSLGDIGAISGVTNYANPTSPAQLGNDVSLSDMARELLSNISTMQSDFQNEVVPAAQGSDEALIASRPVEGADASGQPVTDAAKALVDQIQQSTQVQEQLTRFMMASSVSSSLGRNLNMFLRGQ